MPPLLQSVTYLRPPKGPAIVLTDNETWLGRNSFELSEKAQALCSRRQACLKRTNLAFTLECHGLNPIYFVVCHSVNFHASEDNPPSRLYQLKKGEVVELAAGDKFFLAPKECLLTVVTEPAYDGGAVHLTPDAAHASIHDDTSLADQVCSPKATQLGQGLSNSPAEQHNLLQTAEPARTLSADVRINLADRWFTREIADRNLTVQTCLECRSNDSCKCSILRNTPAPASGLQVPLVQGSPVCQVDFSNSAARGDLTPGDVVIDKRSTDASKTTVVPDNAPEVYGLDSRGAGAGHSCYRTQGGTLAAGSSVEERDCDPSNDTKAGLAVEGIDRDTINCGQDAEIVVTGRPDAQEDCKQVITGNVSGCSDPVFAFSGGAASGEIGIDARRSRSAIKNAVVRLGSAAGESSLNLTQGCTSAAGSSVEGRACSSINDTTGDILVENVHSDTIDCRLESRGPPDLVVKSNPDAHEASKQIITRNVSGCTSSPLCTEANQIQGDMPSSSIPGLDPQQSPPVRCRIPVITELSEKAAASRGKHKGVEIFEISTKRGTVQADSPPEPVPSSQTAALDVISGELPMTIREEHRVHDGRDLPPKRPEVVDLTISDGERKSQARVQSQSAQVGQSICNNSGTGPIEGMENVIVTVSGYEDLLRARLINLISATGASYTGSLTKVNTHVVCWKFRGAKYELAKKLGKNIVNHRWFEDCLKAGARLPEGPYNASGEMSEPLCWDESSVQHPSSTAGLDHDHDCNSLLSRERFMGQARAALMISESSHPLTHSHKRADHFGQTASSPRGETGKLDRGKGRVDLSGPASRLQGCNLGTVKHGRHVVRQERTRTETGDVPVIDLSTPPGAQEQESDEFWNEVIRTYDGREELVTEHSCQVLSKANHTTGLKEHVTRRSRHAASSIPGSSLRELDPEFHDEIIIGGRNAITSEAQSSRVVQGEILQEAMQSRSFGGEQSNVLQSEADMSSYPEVFQRKRKQAFTSENIKGKHRRLMRKSEVSAAVAARDLPSQEGSTLGIIGGITTGGQPTSISGAPQQRAFTTDVNDDGQQRAGVIRVESVSKSEEKVGECASSDEIACVICHSDTKPITEGMLACGHQFCYPCIQRWADEAKSKSPTCPLCKVAFDFITFREMGKAGEDGSCAVLEERIVQIGQQTRLETRLTNLPTLRTENLCVTCGSRDTPELLLICTNCGTRACHTFCLDPPRPPGSSWYCNRCSQMHSRMQTREAYGRLFQGSSPQSSARRQQTIVDMGTNLALQSRSTSRVGALGAGQTSSNPARRGRQYSLRDVWSGRTMYE